jgi:hypothetical protein
MQTTALRSNSVKYGRRPWKLLGGYSLSGNPGAPIARPLRRARWPLQAIFRGWVVLQHTPASDMIGEAG